MTSDARVVAVALGAAAAVTLLGVWFTAWISSFRFGRSRRRTVSEPAPRTRVPLIDRRQLLLLAQELATQAEVSAAQAARAQAELEAAQANLATAETALTQAEAGYDTARLAYAAALGTARAGRPDRPDAAAQEREREVSRAALDAYRRGELTVEALRTVFGRTDPDPIQDEREREADQLGLAEAAARRAFEHAVVVARMAREDLQVAEVADAASRQEATNAILEAQEAQLAVGTARPGRRGNDRRRGSGTAHPTRRDARR